MKQAKLREVLRLHREQRAYHQRSHAHPDNPAIPPPSSIAPSPADGSPPTTAAQALLSLAPALKKSSVQSGDATFPSRPVIESVAKKRKRATSESSRIRQSNTKGDNERGLPEDISLASDTSDEGGEVEGSGEEWERRGLWAVFSSRYAELVGSSEAKQSSTEIATSAGQERVAASTRPATSAASESLAATEKPSGETATGNGGPADPIEIDNS